LLYNENAGGKHKNMDKFKVLQRISSFISSIYSLQHLLSLIMEESKNILNAEASSLLLYDSKEKVLFFEVAEGEKAKEVKKIKLKLGQGIAGVCGKERKIINVKDVSKDRRFYTDADKKTQFSTRSILAVPLTRKKKLLGVLEVLNKKDGKCFTRKDEQLMEIIANQAAVCIENTSLYMENIKNAKMAGVGEAMLSLSHDIKNILNGLTGGIYLVDSTFSAQKDEYVSEGWKIVKTNVNRISDLILDMLNYSSKKIPCFQEVMLGDFIREVVSVYDEKLKEKKVRLDFRFDSRISKAFLDTTGMQRVILNIFSNAFEAVSQDSGCIEITTLLDENMRGYSLDIRDNGKGIPPENLKHIFEIFFTTKGHKGTGLGLAVVKKIVAEHKGTVKVDSEIDKGTAFTITLPLEPGYAEKKT